jgi:hypothetical protein
VRFSGIFEDRSKRQITAKIEARSIDNLMNDLEVREWSALYYHLVETKGEDSGATLLKPFIKPIKKRIVPEREGNPSVSEFMSQNVDCITLHGMVNNSETTEDP